MDSLTAAASAVITVDELAELLRLLRRRQARRRGRPQLTYRDLAARTGWSHGSIGGYFTGKILPPTDRFDVLVQLLDATPAELGALADARDRVEERSRVAAEAAAAAPRQLPAAPSSFTGRAAAIQQLDGVLDSDGLPQSRAVIVIGTAGVGKTALAVHWAHRVAHRFPDGQLYVNLRGFGPGGPQVAADDVLRAFLGALGVAPNRMPGDHDARVGLYRSLLNGRRVLVVLDNAATAQQVRPLLPGSPGSLIVVTSRNQLTGLVATDGARPVLLDLLGAGEARQLLATRLGPARVAADPPAVDTIVAACARLPLALVIVAARGAVHPGFPLAELARELRAVRGGLAALSDADAATDVRSVFSWSYHRLGEAAARLFRMLAVAPGQDLGEATASALAGADAGTALAELAHASLLTEHVPGRYAAHDLLRAYAAELSRSLDTDAERAAATARVLEHYLRSGFVAALRLDPHRTPIDLPVLAGVDEPKVEFADEAQALAWFTAELPTLLACVELAAASGHDIHAWQITWTLVDFLDRRGHWSDWAAVQAVAHAAATRCADPVAEAVTAHQLGRACIRLRRYDEAAVHLELAVERYRQVGDDAGRARVHGNLGFIADRQGRPRDAIQQLLQSLALLRATGDQAGQGSALANLGWLHAAAGEHREALDYCHQALELQQRIADRPGEAYSWDSIGFIHHQLGEHEPAAECYRQALALWREIGDRYGESETLTHLGDLHRAAGDEPEAQRDWLAALSILEELEHPDAEQLRARLQPSASL